MKFNFSLVPITWFIMMVFHTVATSSSSNSQDTQITSQTTKPAKMKLDHIFLTSIISLAAAQGPISDLITRDSCVANCISPFAIPQS